MNFDIVYQKKRWTAAGNGSGPGSTKEYIQPIIKPLQDFIRQEKIETIVDVSCGGMSWWPLVIDEKTNFYGYDIAETPIQMAQEQFKHVQNWHFEIKDATDPHQQFPDCDLLVVRHTMMHLSLSKCKQLLQNVFCSNARFVALTFHPKASNPKEETGKPLLPGLTPSAFCWRPMNLLAYPFSLGPPKVAWRESGNGEEYLGIWQTKPVTVITCITGTQFNYLWPAPLPESSFVLSNNPVLDSEAQRKGWKFIFLKDLVLTSDEDVSSMQSKHVKFLACLADHTVLWSKRILYVDHRRHIQAHHVTSILQLNNLGIVINATPKLKTSVWDEYKDAQHQVRYRKHNDATMAWINAHLAMPEKYKANVRVCNTGLICYNTQVVKIFELVNQMYEALKTTQNPECQIFWSILSQPFSDIISVIPFDVSIEWRNPPP